MSRIQELIKEMCPNGVRYKTVNELISNKIIVTVTPSFKVKKNEYKKTGIIPIISQEEEFISGYCDKEDSHITKRNYVCFGDHSEHIKFIDFPFVQGADGLKIMYTNEKELLGKFFYHTALSTYKRYNNYERHFKYFCEIKIPIPPLKVQEEIVRILDKFGELEAEIEAELEARQSQYEFWSGKIFESHMNGKIKHITDIAMIKARVGWQRLTTAEYLSTGDYYLITGTDFKNDGKIDFNKCVFVTKERYEMDENIQVHKNDILITKDGTLGKVAYLNDEPDKLTTLNSGVFRIKVTDKNVLPRYIYHYFNSKVFRDFVEYVKTGSTIPHLTQEKLVSLNIPIPNIKEQEKIINILDKFEDLTRSFSVGLPAEIELRRKQYEHYRNQLLSFKELNND